MAGLARLMMFLILLCLLVVVTGATRLLWVPFSLIGLSMAMVMMIAGTLMMAIPIIVAMMVIRALLRRVGHVTAPASVAVQPVPQPQPEPRSQPTPTQVSSAKQQLIREGEAKIDEMRTQARRITKPAVRTQTLEICAMADRILAVLPDVGDEVVARDVIARYFAPAETIITRYVTLSGRGVASASATLHQVETDDLPFIERQLHDVYERLNRGDVINLEVAREMLHFNLPTAPIVTSRTPSTNLSPSR